MIGHKGRVLVPVGRASGLRRLVLDLIVPDAELAGAGQLRNAGRDVLPAYELPEWLARLPDIDDLPDRPAVVATHVAHMNGLGNVVALPLVDDTHHFDAQCLHLFVVKHLPAIQKSVGVKLFNLV